MLIRRDFTKTEDVDWELNVQPLMSKLEESVPLFTINGMVIGWRIQYKYS